MTNFYRSGHWRTSSQGMLHWVAGHTVDRSEWPGHVPHIKELTPSSAQSGSGGPSLSTQLYTSYVNPNASCPVCGEAVFFYQSPYGGRVFFDDLGPPWPKHPCTDNSVQYMDIAPSHTNTTSRVYKWKADGWTPALDFTLTKVRSVIYRLDIAGKDELAVFFKSNKGRLHKPPPVFAHYKTEAGSVLRVSLYWLEGGALEFHAYQTPEAALLALQK